MAGKLLGGWLLDWLLGRVVSAWLMIGDCLPCWWLVAGLFVFVLLDISWPLDGWSSGWRLVGYLGSGCEDGCLVVICLVGWLVGLMMVVGRLAGRLASPWAVRGWLAFWWLGA